MCNLMRMCLLKNMEGDEMNLSSKSFKAEQIKMSLLIVSLCQKQHYLFFRKH